MAKSRKVRNPFNAPLVIVGAIFVVTTSAYGLMAMEASRSGETADAVANHPLFSIIRSHGDLLLVVELALLAGLTVGAIATDSYWQRRAKPGATSVGDTPAATDSET